MKTLLAISTLFFLVGCHPPESTIVKINSVEVSTNQPIDSIKCGILENGVGIVEKYTLHGETQMAFDMKPNMHYELMVGEPDSKKYFQIEDYGYNISIGQTNEYNLRFVGNGNLDLGLQTLTGTSTVDFLEYQLINIDYIGVPTISNGWNYGENDIYGAQNNQHFINHLLTAGNYRLDYRVTRSGYTSNATTNILIESGVTNHFVLQY